MSHPLRVRRTTWFNSAIPDLEGLVHGQVQPFRKRLNVSQGRFGSSTLPPSSWGSLLLAGLQRLLNAGAVHKTRCESDSHLLRWRVRLIGWAPAWKAGGCASHAKRVRSPHLPLGPLVQCRRSQTVRQHPHKVSLVGATPTAGTMKNALSDWDSSEPIWYKKCRLKK